MSHNQVLSREDVINAYRFILGRAPESEQVIDGHRGYRTVDELCLAFLMSSEFSARFQYLVGSMPGRRGRKPESLFRRLYRGLAGSSVDTGRLPEVRKHQPPQNPPSATTVHPELEKLRHLQTAPVDDNPGIEAGRNIRAGYLRGTGLEYGKLVPFIEHDPDWIAAIAASGGRSIVAPHRLMNLFLIIKYSDMPGNIIEFGAYTGGSSIFMAALSKRLGKASRVFALDTFTGMPASDPLLDMHGAGDFPANFDELELLKAKLQLDNLVLIKGLFQDGARQIPAEERRFYLSHVDCDIYTSVRFSIAFTKEHAVPGAYIIFDDPLVSTCLGALKPVEQDLVQKEGLFAEQAYPHLVYRFPPLRG
jgi:Macrocin-O-methyltransferase (TylF)